MATLYLYFQFGDFHTHKHDKDDVVVVYEQNTVTLFDCN